MQILNNSNQPTFNGAFRIKPKEINAKKEIPELFTQGRQVFHDILEKGDEVIVVRDNYDKRVAKYIQDHNVTGVEYFPKINTKSGLDSEQPEKLLELIRAKTVEVITDINEMCEQCFKQKSQKSPKAPKSQNELEKISNALRLNIEAPRISSSPEMTIIRDEEKKRTIEVIMANKGNSYVYVRPDSPYEDARRCILDNKGHIMKEFKTPDEMMSFKKQFNKLKQAKANILSDN